MKLNLLTEDQVTQSVLEARKPFHGRYQDDRCPECGEHPEYACRCRRNDRFCKNGHVWERSKPDGMPLLLDRPHGNVVKTY